MTNRPDLGRAQRTGRADAPGLVDERAAPVDYDELRAYLMLHYPPGPENGRSEFMGLMPGGEDGSDGYLINHTDAEGVYRTTWVPHAAPIEDIIHAMEARPQD